MSHDLIIKSGLIVDGTGAEPYRGDVAVDDGIITAVGRIDARAKQQIDADGAAVSPGFIDLHGKSRLLQPSAGYLATIVNGEISRKDNASTGTRPGQVLRSDTN